MSDMFSRKPKKIMDFLQKKGFLLAVVLCLCTVAVAGYMSISSVFDVPSDKDWKNSAKINTDEIKSSIVPVIIPKDDVTINKKENSSSSKVNSTSSDAAVKASTKTIIKYKLPLMGNISKNFSVETPLFSKTLNDYRAHTGIDIEAKDGDAVLSAADGKITHATNDELMGFTIEVTDSDNVISSYSGLKDLSFVKVGNEIKKGEVIGKIGLPPNCEALDGVHLHFQMIKDTIPLNPIDMIK